MSDVTYKTVQGFVFQGPYKRDVQGKEVRDYMLSGYTGTDDEVVRITVWPSHEAVEINIGDYIIVNGKYEAAMLPNKDGEKVLRRNVSANKLVNLGGGLGNSNPDTVATPTQKRVAKTDIDF